MRAVISPSGPGAFTSFSQAAAALKDCKEPLELFLENGFYEERVLLEWEDYTLTGESRDGVILTAGSGAFDPHPLEGKTGTFRTATAFLGGGRCRVKNMTIRNTAGDGSRAGQALAVYADAAQVYMENVTLLGNQDTLFAAPLPLRERIPGGFTGPRKDAPRRPSRQLYRNCLIAGNIDFIFGGADAVFQHCILRPLVPEKGVCYLAAPSTPQHQEFGYLFDHCRVEGTCAPGQVFLARPWRRYGAAGFLDCTFSGEVASQVFDPWGDKANQATSRFFLWNCTGPQGPLSPAFGLEVTPRLVRSAREHIARQLELFGIKESL